MNYFLIFFILFVGYIEMRGMKFMYPTLTVGYLGWTEDPYCLHFCTQIMIFLRKNSQKRNLWLKCIYVLRLSFLL